MGAEHGEREGEEDGEVESDPGQPRTVERPVVGTSPLDLLSGEMFIRCRHARRA